MDHTLCNSLLFLNIVFYFQGEFNSVGVSSFLLLLAHVKWLLLSIPHLVYLLLGFLTYPWNSSSPCFTLQALMLAEPDVENDLRFKVDRKNNPLKTFWATCLDISWRSFLGGGSVLVAFFTSKTSLWFVLQFRKVSMSVVIYSSPDSHLTLDQVCFLVDPHTSRQAACHSEHNIAYHMSVTKSFLSALIANSVREQQALEVN